jgi:PIN domain nuclease of toxin-antitoxin system
MKPMPFVFDACAMIAFLTGEPGSQDVEALLAKDENCVAHAVNMCEVYYDFLKACGDEAIASSAIKDLQSVGIGTREDMDFGFWSVAGRQKAKGGIALADCFAVALALRISGAVVTSDHKEFDPIVQQGQCPVKFIR